MRENTGFVAVTDDVVGAGATVFWSLSSDQDRAAIVEAWTAAGLTAWAVPKARGDEPALWAACDSVVRAHNEVAAQTGAPLLVLRNVPAAPGSETHVLALVWERWTDDTRTETKDGEWRVHARVVMHKGGERDHLDITGAPDDVAQRIREAYARERGRLPHASVSNWIANRLIPSLGGVNLRAASLDAAKAGAGPYYLPPDSLETWRTMVGALRAAGAGKFGSMPTMRSEEAVEAILDGFAAEVEKATAGLEDALVEKDMGLRALRTAERTAAEVAQKVARYEAILGRSLDDLRAKTDRTVAAHTAAVLAAEAAETA